MTTQTKQVLRGGPIRAVLLCLLVIGVTMALVPRVSAEPPRSGWSVKCIDTDTDPWAGLQDVETKDKLGLAGKVESVSGYVARILSEYVPSVAFVTIIRYQVGTEKALFDESERNYRTSGVSVLCR